MMDADIVSSERRSLSLKSHSRTLSVDSSDHRPKKSPLTCSTCRMRKVRCNGTRPMCSNCQRLGFPCSYNEKEVDPWSMSVPRRRVKQACLSCHSRKARCSGHVPTCERCRQHGIECVYKPNRRAREHRLSLDRRNSEHDHHELDDSDAALTDHTSADTPNRQSHDGPPFDETFDSVVKKTFDQFFRHVHHIPSYSFLHRASLMEQYFAGKVDRALLLALVGITSCLSDVGVETRQYGNQCIDEAESRILAEYTVPSTIKVQALVLIIKHRILSNMFPSAFMLFSIASRFAAALRLNHDMPNLCFLAQESRRRLMWSLYCIDISISGGFEEFSLWRAERIHAGLPCNERNFEFDLCQPTETLIPSQDQDPQQPHGDDVASLALYVRIMHIRQKIMEFTKTALVSRNAGAVDLQTSVRALQGDLDDFANRLPASFQFSDSSLRLRAYSPRICIFIMLHVWWRQCHCDLYRLAFSDFRDALPISALESIDSNFLEFCQKQCVDHALAMVEIFASMQKLGATMVADLELATCASQCARMLLSGFRLDPERLGGLTIATLTIHIQTCLTSIQEYCRGPASEAIKSDLSKLLKQGITAEAVPQTSSRSLCVQATHPILKEMRVGDEPEVIHSPITIATASPRRMTGSWSGAVSDNTYSMHHHQHHQQQQQQQIPLESQHMQLGSPFTDSMALNNAYEGAMEGLGLDNGLDHAMGIVDVSGSWGPPNADWMTDFCG